MQDQKPKNVGLIIRTAAENVPQEAIIQELSFLWKQWQTVCRNVSKADTPSCVYRDLDLTFKLIRDLYSDDMIRIVVDERELYLKLKEFLQNLMPGADKRLEFSQGEGVTFARYGLERELKEFFNKKVSLPSGGDLIIDQAEAMTVFDVNTGRFVGHKNQQKTILQTNLEAIKQVAVQIRLRNIGGIIVVDFIDMEHSEDHTIVYETLIKELEKDRAKTTVLPMSSLGLIEMTRQRTRPSIMHQLSKSCPYCQGFGYISSNETLSYELIRLIERMHLTFNKKDFIVDIRQDILHWLNSQGKTLLKPLHEKYSINVKFSPRTKGYFDIYDDPYKIL